MEQKKALCLGNEALSRIEEWCEILLRAILCDADAHNITRLLNLQRPGQSTTALKRSREKRAGDWMKTAAQRAAVLSEIQQLLYANHHLTLRDLFYRQFHVFENQKESDDSVAYFTRAFELPRWRLHVVSSPRGLIRGYVSFQLHGIFKAELLRNEHRCSNSSYSHGDRL